MKKSYIDYIWLDEKSQLRTKTKIIPHVFHMTSRLHEHIPTELCDNRSIAKDVISPMNSNFFLKPVQLYRNPFKSEHHYIVLCETLLCELKRSPTPCNRRNTTRIIFNSSQSYKPMLSIGVQFHFYHQKTNKALGENKTHYCGVGKDVFGSEIMEQFADMCTFAGINLTGYYPQKTGSQWEYQIDGNTIKVCDDVYTSIYILKKLCSSYNIFPHLNHHSSKLIVRFSTKKMREKNGLSTIVSVIERLQAHHNTHRLDELPFTWGFNEPDSCISIDKKTELEGKGCFEDRRYPATSCVYRICYELLQLVCFRNMNIV